VRHEQRELPAQPGARRALSPHGASNAASADSMSPSRARPRAITESAASCTAAHRAPAFAVPSAARCASRTTW